MGQVLRQLLKPVLGPCYETARDVFWRVFALDQKTSLAWVATFLLLSLLVWWRRGRASTGGSGFWSFVFDRKVYLHRSAKVDYQFFLVNKVFYVAFFGALSVSATGVAGMLKPLLAHALPNPRLGLSPLQVNIGFSIASVVAFDLAYFVAHLLMHKVPVFWELHRVHHSAEVLTPITNYREHPLDSLFQAAFQGTFVGVVNALFGWAFPEVALLTFAGVNVFYLPYYAFANLRHSHVGLSFGRRLGHVFSSPLQHQAHHGAAPQYIDVNFGIFLSVWDWLAGTLYLPAPGEKIPIGLAGEPGQDYTDLWKVYVLPLRRIHALLKGAPVTAPLGVGSNGPGWSQPGLGNPRTF